MAKSTLWALGGLVVLTCVYFTSLWKFAPICTALVEVSCLSLNELGDFLAGVFAPVAFLWLAGAVFLQSLELSSQRQELKLNRSEFIEQRNVLKQQAEEARRQAEAIGFQTDLLRVQTNDRTFDARVQTLFHWLRHVGRIYIEIRMADGRPVSSFVLPSGKTMDPEQSIIGLARSWHSREDEIKGFVSSEAVLVEQEGSIRTLIERLERLNFDSGSLSPEKVELLYEIKYEKLIIGLKWLLPHVQQG
ncbi:hypothetical protein QBK99_05205 [Corticibacterium sp. UT-5YL-CI-8]|nr:hypothetical protein [Tianweitania sp. UT-5YL-CI-8]